MSQAQAERETPLRLWPGVLIVVVVGLGRFVLPRIWPETMPFGMLGGLLGGLLILVWWAFFSRAPRGERLGAVLLMLVALLGAWRMSDPSVRTAMMGLMYFIYALPGLCIAFVAWALVAGRLAPGPRRALLTASIVIACGLWVLVRSDGVTGSTGSDLAWRWTETSEERLLAQGRDEPLVPAPAASTDSGDDAPVLWSGFRGPARDGVLRGARIETDWVAAPPRELWRRAVGPGWSSFAVRGDLFYTQEQRGEEELVSCYRVETGEPVWRHSDPVRFWEANAGAGPRGTPTLSGERVYALGATGILNALDARSGSLVWSRDAAADAKMKAPYWGFSSSPEVIDDLVMVGVSGALVAYELASGEPRWIGRSGGESYSSPQRVTLDGVDQVVLMSEAGAVGVTPADGHVLWEHAWPGYPIVQPALTQDGELLLCANERSGTRRIAVRQGPAGWNVEGRWTSIRMKPYFNDLVVHEGHAYGFDGSILACIDLADGQRRWKGGRYGNGQMLLLADQNLLLVLTEQGQLALVEAKPDGFDELALVPAIEGKTWNHPVLAGDRLLVRNDQEMAAFRLTLIRE